LAELKKKYLETPGQKSKRSRQTKDSSYPEGTSSMLHTSSKFSIDMPETLKHKIDQEKLKSQELDKKIAEYQETLLQLRKNMGGVNSGVEKQKKMSKEIKNLENRLDKAMQKYNQTISHNKQLRLEIDKLRKDKNIYEATYKKLQEDLNNKRTEMADAIASAEQAYKNREVALKTLEELKKENEKEQEQYEKEWTELLTQIEQEKKKKEFIQMKEKEKLLENSLTDIDPEDEKKIRNLTKLSEAEKISTNESVQLVKNYEEALEKIKAETGVETLQDLVDAFLGYEEKNTALLNFVNELTAEIEQLEKQIEDIKSEIARYKQMGALTDTSKKRMLQKMEEKLASMEFKNAINEQRQKESMKTISFIKEQLKNFIQTLDPDEALLKEMDDEALTESNMMHYLSEVELKANKIIQSYALIQAQRLQVEAIVKDDPMLHRANIAALNNVMALGSQATGNNAPITISLPAMQDDDEEPGDGDDDEVPLTVDELRSRAERHIQNFKLSRGVTMKNTKQNKRTNKK
jgi:coiled-coil domain-containing protein 63/114